MCSLAQLYDSPLFHSSTPPQNHPLLCLASTLWCCSRDLVGLLFPLGMSWFLGFHPLFHHCVCNGSATLLHCIYFTWVCLPAQITGSATLNATSLAFPWERPSLRDHLPQNKIASQGARTTASVILSSRPSWDICRQLIGQSTHGELGVTHLSLPLKSLYHGCNNASSLHLLRNQVDTLMIRVILMMIHHIV